MSHPTYETIIPPSFRRYFAAETQRGLGELPGVWGLRGLSLSVAGLPRGGTANAVGGCLRNRKSGGKTAEDLQEQLNAAFHNSKEARKDQEVAKKGGNYTENGKEKLEHLRQES